MRSTKEEILRLLRVVLSCVILLTSIGAADELILDTVLASVDNEPVTLMDLSKAVGKDLNLSEYKEQTAALKPILDSLINRKIIEREAEDSKIRVSEEEIAQQVAEIAAQNRLSMEEFDQALREQNQSLDSLRSEVRFQILRSKVVRMNVRNQSVVSDEEVNKYLGISDEEERVNISFVLLPFEKGSPTSEQTKELAKKIFKAMDSNVPFTDILNAYSQPGITSADNKIVARKDLSEVILEALDGLEDGQTARPILFANGIQIVRLNKALSAGEKIDSAIIERARIELQSKTMQQNAMNFLTEDLPKKHHVEILG